MKMNEIEVWNLRNNPIIGVSFIFTKGAAISAHLRRCKRFAVDFYSFTF
jgi:hypothetical protein